ncbi:MAG: hypothetical protein U9P12_07870, partial [Verrucomicrobiota bacterium]|nr:hypothetical protein [Verrucomicrobiota bacterium]
TAGASFSAGTLGRSLSTYSVSFGDLWMAYLFRFDTDRSTIPDDEWLEVRPGTGDMRMAIDETFSAVELRYGSDYSISTEDSNVKNGTTLLYVAKFPDMGSATGSDAKGWVLAASEYDSMLANGGVSETNLDTYAGIQLSNSFNADSTMAGNVTMQLIPLGRNSSTPSFYIDELRLGTSLDVVAPAILPSGVPTIIGWSAHSGNIMKMVIDAPGRPVDYSPAARSDLVFGGWTNVAHSDNGVNSFVVTNLDYSTVDATGTNEVIYVQSTDAAKFFRVNVD